MIYLSIEIDQHDERNYSEYEQSAPIEVRGVDRGRPHLGGLQSHDVVVGLVEGAGGDVGGAVVEIAVGVLVDDLGLEESGSGEEDGEEGDAGDVLDDALGEGVGLVHGLAVVERVVHGEEPLEGDGHCHEDGRGDGDLVEGVQEVGKQDDVEVGGQVELLAKGLEDGAEEVGRVEAGHRHQ